VRQQSKTMLAEEAIGLDASLVLVEVQVGVQPEDRAATCLGAAFPADVGVRKAATLPKWSCERAATQPE
jgi:hypothetical protein